MAAFGNVANALTLAGFFNDAVDSFRAFEFGKDFERDIGQCMIELEVNSLQINRWGISVGLDKVHSGSSRLSVVHSSQDIETAIRIFKSILSHFTKAEKIFNDVFSSARKEDLAYSQASSGVVAITERMRMIHGSRVGKLKPHEKVGWAFIKRDQFLHLVNGISKLTEKLIENFPGDEIIQKRLCGEEAEQINELYPASDDLKSLKTAAECHDKRLLEALDEAALKEAQVGLFVIVRFQALTHWLERRSITTP